MSETLYTSYNVELNEKRNFVEVGKKPNGADYRYLIYPFIAGVPVKGEKDEFNRIGDLKIDLDCKADPQKSCDDAGLIINYFEEIFNIDPYAWSIFVSGGKGIHLGLKSKYFGLSAGHKLLPKIYKAFMSRLCGNLDLSTVDTSIYSMGMGKPFRLANVKRENGRYKVPIEYDELSLGYEELYEFTASPRYDVDVAVDCDISTVLVDQVNELAEFVTEAEGAYVRPVLSEEQTELLKKGSPPCIEFLILDNSPPEPECRDFNRISMTLIRYAQSAGLGHSDTVELSRPFLEGYSGSSSCKTPEQKTTNFCNRFWSMNGGTFHFDCGYVRGLRIDGMNDACAKCVIGTGGEVEEVFDVVELDEEEDVGEDAIEGAVVVDAVKDKEIPLIRQFLKRYYLCTSRNEVVDCEAPPDIAMMPMPAFKNTVDNKRIIKKGVPPISKEWLLHPKRKDVVGVYYHPGKDNFFKYKNRDGLVQGWFNPFHIPIRHYTEDEDKLEVPLNHLRMLMHDDEGFDYFLGWLAYSVIRPELRLQVTPLSVSTTHGIGRGWIQKLMEKLMGVWNCTSTTMEELAGEGNKGAYHNYLHRSVFCNIPEVKVGAGKFEIDDAVRDKLTNDIYHMNLKYGDNETLRIFSSFFMASNHRDALVLPVDDRRVWVKETFAAIPNGKYFEQLYDWLDDIYALDQLYFYLKRMIDGVESGVAGREMSFKPKGRAPVTREKIVMMQGSGNVVEEAFNSVMSSNDLCKDICTFTDIKSAVKKQIGMEEDLDEFSADVINVNDKHLMAMVRSKCIQAHSGKKIKVMGKTSLYWIVRNFNKWSNADVSDMRAEIKNYF